MPRFHFNVYDGVTDIDHEGQLLPSWTEARLVAIQCAGNIIADDRKRLALGEDWRMEVTDKAGLVLFRLDFSIREAPVIGGRPPVLNDPS